MERAVREKRPIFLSAGLVADNAVERMHREAFINGENAEALNAYFVPVLLDAVAHPELADAVELIARSMGATTASVHLVLTPALEPFAAAGFLSTAELNRLLVINANRWAEERGVLAAEGRANLQKAQERVGRRIAGDVDVEAVVDAVAARYEKEKTLEPADALFLFRYAARTKHETIRDLAVTTLRQRAASRRYDGLGGGFHRCDGCFEKILPDQAENALAYLEAWRITKDPNDARVVRSTLDYLLRDLRPPDTSTFHASQDAHSYVPAQGPELMNGAFYAWTREEVVRLLGDEGAGKVWPALEDPRLLHETHGELAPLLARLREVRQKRPAPFRDPTVVAGWSGLAISALALTASAMNVPEYLEAASRGANAVTAKLWKKTLTRTDGGAEAIAEDYALLVQGLLDLYDAGGDVKWLELAATLQQRQDALFWDASAGRYIAGKSLPNAWRGLVIENGANAVSAMNLLRIAALTGNETLRARTPMIFQSSGRTLTPALAGAYELSQVAPRTTVVTGDPRKLETHELLRSWRERLDPMRAVVFVPNKGPARDRVTKVLPFTRALAPDEKLPVAYECAGGECKRQ